MTLSFMSLGGEATENLIINYTKNPIIALFIGILGTALTQSSSLTTSIVVSLVATGFFPDISTAVPIIIGANIGTSVTSTIVSLAHVKHEGEFHKAFSAGTLHDFFNLIAIIIILPLELSFGFLSNTATFLYQNLLSGIHFPTEGNTSSWSLSALLKFIANSIFRFLWSNAVINLIIAFIVLFFSLKSLSGALKNIVFKGNNKDKFQKRIFGTVYGTFFWGIGLTALVQSSSITTSLAVPLVATNIISLKKALPFLMGANVGTTLTALIASVSTPNEASITIALCHLLYNSFAVSVFMMIPFFQGFPVYLSERMGKLVLRQKWYGFAYVAILFFGIPMLLIYFS
jgi:sodium-dependent phosphate cotransporter